MQRKVLEKSKESFMYLDFLTKCDVRKSIFSKNWRKAYCHNFWLLHQLKLIQDVITTRHFFSISAKNFSNCTCFIYTSIRNRKYDDTLHLEQVGIRNYKIFQCQCILYTYKARHTGIITIGQVRKEERNLTI